jgi:hypothetical protein
MKWAESCQQTSRPDEDAFNEFEEEREVWKLLLTEITKKFEGEDVSLHQLLHELDLTSKTARSGPLIHYPRIKRDGIRACLSHGPGGGSATQLGRRQER